MVKVVYNVHVVGSYRENWHSPVIQAILGRLELWDGLKLKGLYHLEEGYVWPHYSRRTVRISTEEVN